MPVSEKIKIFDREFHKGFIPSFQLYSLLKSKVQNAKDNTATLFQESYTDFPVTIS